MGCAAGDPGGGQQQPDLPSHEVRGGGPLEAGPFADFLGYDDNVQAGTGIMVRYGGSHETCEEHAHVGTIDTIAGVCGAASTLYALLRLHRDGVVCEARTSLAAVAQYLQYPFLHGAEPPCVGGVGPRCMGMAPYYCVYRARDCFLVVTGRVRELLQHAEAAAFFATQTPAAGARAGGAAAVDGAAAPRSSARASYAGTSACPGPDVPVHGGHDHPVATSMVAPARMRCPSRCWPIRSSTARTPWMLRSIRMHI